MLDRDWRDKRFKCPCGWSGLPDEMPLAVYSQFTQHRCPECDQHVLLVSYPCQTEVLDAVED